MNSFVGKYIHGNEILVIRIIETVALSSCSLVGCLVAMGSFVQLSHLFFALSMLIANLYAILRIPFTRNRMFSARTGKWMNKYQDVHIPLCLSLLSLITASNLLSFWGAQDMTMFYKTRLQAYIYCITTFLCSLAFAVEILVFKYTRKMSYKYRLLSDTDS